MIKQTAKNLYAWLDRSAYRWGVRSLDNLTLPNFLGLGSGQSGTTWLFEHLGKHPDVFIPHQKEIHYFDQTFNSWPLSYYASKFESQDAVVRGEVSPGYSILTRKRIRQIHQLLPQVRLILIMRNPVERSWSGLRRVLGKMKMPLDQTPDELIYQILEQEWTYTGSQLPTITGDYEPGLLEGFYTTAIDNWLSVFPKKQLLITFFDDLENHPEKFLSQVHTHIGVDHRAREKVPQKPGKVNANPPAPLPDRFREFLENKYKDEIARIQQRYGGPANSWLTNRTVPVKGKHQVNADLI